VREGGVYRVMGREGKMQDREKGGGYRQRRGGKKEERKRGNEHQIQIFYLQGGYFQGSNNFSIFCKSRLRFLV